MFSGNNEADNLPVFHNPDKWEQLEKLTIATLGIMGELGGIQIQDVRKHMDLIKSKAINGANFQTVFVDGANHNYQNREKELSATLINWLESRFK